MFFSDPSGRCSLVNFGHSFSSLALFYFKACLYQWDTVTLLLYFALWYQCARTALLRLTRAASSSSTKQVPVCCVTWPSVVSHNHKSVVSHDHKNGMSHECKSVVAHDHKYRNFCQFCKGR